MDYSLPIAKRTRRREAEMYKVIHAEIIKQKKNQGKGGSACPSSTGGPSSVVRGQDGVEARDFGAFGSHARSSNDGDTLTKNTVDDVGLEGRGSPVELDSDDEAMFVGERFEADAAMNGEEFVRIDDDSEEDDEKDTRDTKVDGDDDGDAADLEELSVSSAGEGGEANDAMNGQGFVCIDDDDSEEDEKDTRDTKVDGDDNSDGEDFEELSASSAEEAVEANDAIDSKEFVCIDDDDSEEDEKDTRDTKVDGDDPGDEAHDEDHNGANLEELSDSSDEEQEGSSGREEFPLKRHAPEASLDSIKRRKLNDDQEFHGVSGMTRAHSDDSGKKGSKVKDGDDSDGRDVEGLLSSSSDSAEKSGDGQNVVEGEACQLPLKRHKVSGEETPVGGGRMLDEQELDCIAKRTRSSAKKGGKAEEADSRLDEGDDEKIVCAGGRSGHDRKISHKKGSSDSKEVRAHNVNEKKGFQTSSKGNNASKRKRSPALKGQDVVKILADSLLHEAEVPDIEEHEPCKQPDVRRLFTSGLEGTKPPQKSAEEKELDRLWAEFYFVLYGADNDEARMEDSTAGVNRAAIGQQTKDPVAGLTRAELCGQGNHELILDEEIGLICKYCRHVQVEIKYYVPPFGTKSSGRSRRRVSATDKHSNFDLHLDSGHGSQPGDPCLFPSGKTVWDIIPGIGKGMHDHQREGFEFLWNKIAGGIRLDKLKESTSDGCGSGCIISHAPGTGKTRLAIVFLRTYMKLYPTCSPVIVAPKGMLLSWEAEFRKWQFDMPCHNLNESGFSGRENVAALKLYHEAKSAKRLANPNSARRMVKLYSWKKDASVLLLSYKLFEMLVAEGKKKKKKDDGVTCNEDNQEATILHDLTGLLILDEGHTPRRHKSLIWNLVSKFQTRKRIILSGTPFQNNFDELFNTLSLASPNFAEAISYKHSGSKHLKRTHKSDRARGNWASLTSPIAKFDDDRQRNEKLEEVRQLMKRFVHVHRGDMLQKQLPGLRDSVIILQPEPFQKTLLNLIPEARNIGYFNWENLVSLVSVHPSLFPRQSINKEGPPFDWDKLERLALNPQAGVKTKFLMELIWFSAAKNEKVLVFSQLLDPLELIIKQLYARFKWERGEEVLYMNGQLDAVDRQKLIKDFNNPEHVSKVLLASTRACSEGINLIGASRVVLLDVVWNPSVERQAISRAYRLGQEKVVYTYHLLASETMEEEKYSRQVGKERLSELVLYSSDQAGNHPNASTGNENLESNKDIILEYMLDHQNLKCMFKKIIEQPKESLCKQFPGLMDLQQT
ncbi:hypothetical protein Tsubulata_043523 [Turnera subulata]|uniref:Uncharacterized protein n=1 Tax=Turnera subulata TaxID=218843 RepID=A0A9Q0J741_9ROSI|nr:hypothetical protein Tsubulata_043523 [Turnera subulata]